MKTKKYIVITSIFSPTKAVKKFSELTDWNTIVVGDKKTPKSWRQKNVEFISELNQKNVEFKIGKLLPWNHYSRKMIGYLQAVKNGANIIADTDDDNIPLSTWGVLDFENKYKVISNIPYLNVYNLYTNNKKIWPRGFPLSKLLIKGKYTSKIAKVKVGIWQFLADEDADVDAIYRLTDNSPVYFKKNIKNLVLDKKCFCPINSQNTFFSKEVFPLLYLPAYVNFRITDILRGYIAQMILWKTEFRVGFGTATVIQKRNIHDYQKDFESEIPLYINAEKIINIIERSIKKESSIQENLINCYNNLYLEKFVIKKELTLLKAWLKDLEKLK